MDVQVLGVLADRSIEFVPWLHRGDQLMARLEDAAKAMPIEQAQELAIAAMGRYARLSIGADGRVVLPGHLCHYLSPSGEAVIRIVVQQDRMTLWSETRWQEGQTARNAFIDGLLDRGEKQSRRPEGSEATT